MTIERKVGMGIAGQPSGGPTDVADVFSTYLYTGNSNYDASTQSIDNGIDLADEGGLVWLKDRSATDSHALIDTINGATKRLSSNSTDASGDFSSYFSFPSSGTKGFNVLLHGMNLLGRDYVSWTFRKKEKFFDIITWTGVDGTERTRSHSLGTTVGMIVIKDTTTANNWFVYHKNSTSTPKDHYLNLDGTTQALSLNKVFGTNAPTDTEIQLRGNFDTAGKTYVAYLFADNSSEDVEDQMIKCGSYTGNGAADGPTINLGWEPQFLLYKNADATGSWTILDSMRGIPMTGDSAVLKPNVNDAEDAAQGHAIELNPTGFKATVSYGNTNGSGQQIIYMAIRAPMMVEPEAATDVFAVDGGSATSPSWTSGFPVDMAFQTYVLGTDGNWLSCRLNQGRRIDTSGAGAEVSYTAATFDYMDGWANESNGASRYSWMWKRAKGYMDVVSYTDNSNVGITVNHSLGVIPEMMWLKMRNSAGTEWSVYHSALPNTSVPRLNQSAVPEINQTRWNSTNPTDTVFSTTESGGDFIVYLFATLAGISKVGSYTGNGSSQTISCGFSAGSRFILIKRVDVASAYEGWWLWDATRGIVAGNDPRLRLNHTGAQVTTDDSVDPHNSGFIVNQVSATNINVSSGTYIFYAIA